MAAEPAPPLQPVLSLAERKKLALANKAKALGCTPLDVNLVQGDLKKYAGELPPPKPSSSAPSEEASKPLQKKEKKEARIPPGSNLSVDQKTERLAIKSLIKGGVTLKSRYQINGFDLKGQSGFWALPENLNGHSALLDFLVMVYCTKGYHLPGEFLPEVDEASGEIIKGVMCAAAGVETDNFQTWLSRLALEDLAVQAKSLLAAL